MTIEENIDNGKYANQVPYPNRPIKPAEPKGPLYNITAEQLEQHKKDVAEHAVHTVDYRAKQEEYSRGEATGIALFWTDVADDYGIPHDCPFFAVMKQMAWDNGHSAGFHEVYGVFQSLTDLYWLYVKAKKGG